MTFEWVGSDVEVVKTLVSLALDTWYPRAKARFFMCALAGIRWVCQIQSPSS